MSVYYLKDDDLISGLKKGEDSAFESLLDLYGDRVLKVCFLILRDSSLAEDAVQEVFVRVYKNIKKFRGQSSLYTWIYRIAVNKCRDILKGKNENPSLDEGLEIESDVDVEEEVLCNTDNEKIRDAVFSLSPRYREIVILFYFEELMIKDICEILGETEGTVKSRLHRARNILREMLAEEVFGYGKGKA